MSFPTDIDQLVDLITERIRTKLHNENICTDDPDCGGCNACVINKPWSVRAIEEAGASRITTRHNNNSIGTVPENMATLIDHTLLKPEATQDEIKRLCEDAKKHNFASVCVNTTWVPLCKRLLRGHHSKVCTVVGFPLGAMSPTAKAYEAKEAVRQGADEVDMVVNIGALKSCDYETVFEDICRVVKASTPAIVKVIIESGALNEEQKIIACTLSKLAGASFVKTSTGFGQGGATVEDVALMRRIVGNQMGVKASGGVRSSDDVKKMATAGANRVGASASVAIVTGQRSTSHY